MNYNYKIFTIYHNKFLEKKFNLINDEHHELFYTQDQKNNLSYCQKFICESCGIVYPYLNNLKYDFIGFEHYRRRFNINDVEKYIKNENRKKFLIFKAYQLDIDHQKKFRLNKYYTEYKYLEDFINRFLSLNTIIEYDIIEYLNINYPDILNSLKHPNKYMFQYCMFVTIYDEYVKLAEFIYKYIQFIENKYQLHNYNDWYYHLRKFIIPQLIDNYHNNIETNYVNFINYVFCKTSSYNYYDHTHLCNLADDNINIFRIYAFIIEYLISIYISYICDYNNDYDIINNWYE